MRMQQVALRDAPDPRESRPPCYSDAIRMPRLDGSFASLDELTSNKRRKRKENDQNHESENEIQLRRIRCRSEEVISMREDIRSMSVPPRVHPFEVERLNHQSSTDDVPIQEPNMIVQMEHSPRSSRMRNQTLLNRNQDENRDEELQNFNQSSASVQRSPYSRRSHNQTLRSDCGRDEEISHLQIVENHFQKIEPINNSSSTSSSEFEAVDTMNFDKNEVSTVDGFIIMSDERNIEGQS